MLNIDLPPELICRLPGHLRSPPVFFFNFFYFKKQLAYLGHIASDRRAPPLATARTGVISISDRGDGSGAFVSQ